jgi:hypothetical protein
MKCYNGELEAFFSYPNTLNIRSISQQQKEYAIKQYKKK